MVIYYVIFNVYTPEKKYFIINAIAGKAPKKFQDRAKMLMESNMSWIFASSAGHTWYSYLMLRYGWKISSHDIQKWHEEIETIFGKFHILYKINNYFINILIAAIPIMLIFIYLSKAFT